MSANLVHTANRRPVNRCKDPREVSRIGVSAQAAGPPRAYRRRRSGPAPARPAPPPRHSPFPPTLKTRNCGIRARAETGRRRRRARERPCATRGAERGTRRPKPRKCLRGSVLRQTPSHPRNGSRRDRNTNFPAARNAKRRAAARERRARGIPARAPGSKRSSPRVPSGGCGARSSWTVPGGAPSGCGG